jgi:hypothetical protein
MSNKNKHMKDDHKGRDNRQGKMTDDKATVTTGTRTTRTRIGTGTGVMMLKDG